MTLDLIFEILLVIEVTGRLLFAAYLAWRCYCSTDGKARRGLILIFSGLALTASMTLSITFSRLIDPALAPLIRNISLIPGFGLFGALAWLSWHVRGKAGKPPATLPLDGECTDD